MRHSSICQQQMQKLSYDIKSILLIMTIGVRGMHLIPPRFTHSVFCMEDHGELSAKGAFPAIDSLGGEFKSKADPERLAADSSLRDRIWEIFSAHPVFGYRRVCAIPRRDGCEVTRSGFALLCAK